MKPTVLFWVHGVAALVFGLAFLLVPGMMTDMLNVPTDSMGLVGWQFFGLMILAVGGIVWGSRHKLVRGVKIPIMLMAFLVLVAMTLLHAVLAFSGTIDLNLSMWSVIVFHAALAVWYGYFLFSRDTAPASHAEVTA